jgi:hypothetical protein
MLNYVRYILFIVATLFFYSCELEISEIIKEDNRLIISEISNSQE